MAGLQSLQSVQFVTIKGRRYAVLRREDWDAVIEWLETLDDLEAARQALEALRAAGGVDGVRRRRGGCVSQHNTGIVHQRPKETGGRPSSSGREHVAQLSDCRNAGTHREPG